MRISPGAVWQNCTSDSSINRFDSLSSAMEESLQPPQPKKAKVQSASHCTARDTALAARAGFLSRVDSIIDVLEDDPEDAE